MSKKTSKFIFHLIISIVLTLGLSLSFQSLLAAWQSPTANPPDGNVAGPIFNDSTDSDPISWPFIDHSLGIGSNLTVVGSITSGGQNVCLADGTNCSSGTSIWALKGTSAYYNGGNVGIGTSSPIATLHVVANEAVQNREFLVEGYSNNDDNGPNLSALRARGTSASPANVVNGDDLGGTTYSGYFNGDWRESGFMDVIVDGTPTINGIPTSFDFWTSNGGPAEKRLTIKPDGRVGIGTDNPAGILEVAQNLFIYTGNGANNTGGYPKCPCDTTVPSIDCDHKFFTSSISGDYCYDQSSTSWYAYFRRDASYPSLFVSSNGHIGIGTDNPQEEVQINANTVLFNDSSVEMVMNNTGTVADWEMNFYDDFKLQSGSYGGGWTTRLFVGSDGNVGIGTENPQQKLEISSVMRLTPTDAPGTCDASREGSIYYDNSLGELCDCNGTSWAQVDGGGGC